MAEVVRVTGPDGARRATAPPDDSTWSTRWEGTAVVSCCGDLDPSGHAELRDALAALMQLEPDRIVLDLSKLVSFDAADAAGLARTRDVLDALSDRLDVRSPLLPGRRWLDALGLDGRSDASSTHVSPRIERTGESIDRDVALLSEAWRTACKNNSRLGSEPLFVDPRMVVAAVVELLDDPHRDADTSTIADRLAGWSGSDGSSTTEAVSQLLSLWRVVQAWIGWGPSEDRHLLQERLAEAMDVAVAAVVAAGLGEPERVALIDPLTGLLNRRALDTDLPQALGAARRHRRSLTVVVLDMDGLQAINDRDGHEAGDAALQELAVSLTSALRIGDNAFRIGGDEFVLLLPDLRPEDVGAVIDRIVVSARGTFTWGSAGMSADVTDTSVTPASLVALADRRMIEYRTRRRSAGGRTELPQERPTGGRSTTGSVHLLGQIADGANSFILIEQAKGILAEHFGLRIDAVDALLQDFSERSQRPVHRVAAGLVDRSLHAEELVARRGAEGPPASDPSTGPVPGDTT